MCFDIRDQGWIYIGVSGSVAPGPEVPEGPFESKIKIWETDFTKLEKDPGTKRVHVHWGRAVGPQFMRPTT